MAARNAPKLNHSIGFADGFYQALGYFLAAGWIWIAFRGGREAHLRYRSRFKAFLLVVAISVGLAFLSRTNLGTHVQDSDPIMGGGDVATDYEPTDAQRNKAATLVFLLSFLPASVSLLETSKSIRRRPGTGDTGNSG